MAEPSLSSTTCGCDDINCDSFDCCTPVAVTDKPCIIEPVAEEVCIDYDAGEPFVEEGFFQAVLVDENCDRLIITEDCQPIWGNFKIN